MLAKKYKSRLISIENPLPGLYTLEFMSLSGRYRYLPGQFLHLSLDSDYDGSGQWPDSRCFSMLSTPDQSTIKISYSVKGNFTRQMQSHLATGSEVWLKLPYGSLFSQQHQKANSVFIAGGTGITPFLSLFLHSSFKEYVNPVIYLGFRTKDHNIFKAEIKSIACNKISTFYEDVDGMLDIKKILSENSIDNSYFISGPPDMIREFRNYLIAGGVPAANVITDDWE